MQDDYDEIVGTQMSMAGLILPMNKEAFLPLPDLLPQISEKVSAQSIDADMYLGTSNFDLDAPPFIPTGLNFSFSHNTPWMGKPSTFFVMKKSASSQVMDPNNPTNQEMNDDQWDFIFQYYPEYAQSPYSMMSWIFDQAIKNENEDTFYTISEWMMI